MSDNGEDALPDKADSGAETPRASQVLPPKVPLVAELAFGKPKLTDDTSEGSHEAAHTTKVLLHNVVKGTFSEVYLLESEVLCSHLVHAAEKALQLGWAQKLYWVVGDEQLEFDLEEQLSVVGIGDGSVVGVLVASRTCVLTAASGPATIWDSDTGQCQMLLQGHGDGVMSAKFSADGSRILTASHDKTAKIWDSATGECQMTLEGHAQGLHSATFSPDASRVVTVCLDGSAKIWETKSGQCQATLLGHGFIFFAGFSPDGAFALTGPCFNGTARIWEIASGQCRATLAHDLTLPAVFSPDGTLVLTVCSDGTVKSWESQSGRHRVTFAGNDNAGDNSASINSAVFSPDGAFVLTASSDGSAKIWETESGKCQLTLEGHQTNLISAVFSPDGGLVLTACFDGVAKIWETASGRCRATLLGNEGEYITAASFSPDGSLVLVGCDEGYTDVWETESGQWRVTLEEESVLQTAVFSPLAKPSRSGN